MIVCTSTMRVLIVTVLTFSMALTSNPSIAQEAAVLLKEEPVEYLGGYPGYETKDSVKGRLTITTDAIIFESGEDRFEVAPELVTFVSTGEFAKRRVKGALVGAILLTPLFLFALIGKKKRGIMLIEYSDQKGKSAEGEEPKLTGAPIFRYKPKGGRAIAIEQSVSRVTGLEIVDQEPDASQESADKDSKTGDKELPNWPLERSEKMPTSLNENLMRLRQSLCVDDDLYCRACFHGGPHASEQNPPNVFRNQTASARPNFFFIFDKPNDNDRLKAKGLKWAPVEILDDRDLGNPTRLNLVKLLTILGMVEGTNDTSGVLSSSNFHITNAVKCDKCAVSGETGRVEIKPVQSEQCKRNFFYRELEILNPKALVMFGANPDKFITGHVGKSWAVRDEMVNGQSYKVVRVPHTTATPFNTHGMGVHAYKVKLSDFWRCYS